MQSNFITQLLGIKERYIVVEHMEASEGIFHIELSTKIRRVTCSKCKCKTRGIRGYRNQNIQGRLIEEKPVVFHLRKRRYKCGECDTTFYEPLTFVTRYQRRTASLNEQALVYIAENSFQPAARMCGITASSLIRFFDKRTIP